MLNLIIRHKFNLGDIKF